MDVHCSTCGEPWDVDHLWHDAIFETDLSLEEAEDWRVLPPDQKLTQRYRDKFLALNWEFGDSVINVIHCPCCPPDAKADPDHLAIKFGLEELLGDDEDGLAAAFEDYGP
ncbi:MAG: hypothetical protein ACRD2L_17130 [Terriglobia bacterium]